MSTANELLRQGRTEELWQMCCGYLKLDINQFMDVQKRLLTEQLELLNNSTLGKKIMGEAQPRTLEEFRAQVPLTTYADYLPELLEKQEDTLPEKPLLWAHSSGRSGEYPYKWTPVSKSYAKELSSILYGIGMLSCSDRWGDISRIPKKIKILYSVAPRPYISGTFAHLLRLQTPLEYIPSLEESEELSFEERVRVGFQQSLSQGMDYFFGLSLILVSVGEKFLQSSGKFNVRPYLGKPGALWRLAKGKLKSRLAGRPMLPKDIWSLRGIIGSGLDSWVYKDKILELWGRKPLDLYSCSEGGVIATQTWDYEGMTFIPNLNLLEFIPEEETIKWQMDSSYKPKTFLLDEVQPGEAYELVLTNFHGGAMIRYRIGDMVRILSLENEKLGIKIPQMAFERRADDLIDFVFVRLTERSIWQAIESIGVPYADWIAHRKEGESTLKVFLELQNGSTKSEEEISNHIYKYVTTFNNDITSVIRGEFANFIDFQVETTLLPEGTFARYIRQKQDEGADLAHLKPPHINPSEKVLSLILDDSEEVVVIKKPGLPKVETFSSKDDVENDKITV